MSDIHIYIEREQPVKVITLEPSGKRGPAGATGPAGPAGPNSVTSATTSDGTAELEIASLSVTNLSYSLLINNTAEIEMESTGVSAYYSSSGIDLTAEGVTLGVNAAAVTLINGINESALTATASVYTSFLEGGTAQSVISSDSIQIGTEGVGSVNIYATGNAEFSGDVTVEGTLTADHIHGNLAGSVYAHVRAGENLAKGDPVYISGSHGSGSTLIPIVSKADASNAAKMPAVGIMDAALANNANGHMVITGTITDLNTNAYTVNSVLYVATGGGFTATPPAANSQPVAIVERANTNNGAVIVKVNGLASSGGNGASDANKLVRFTSTGGISQTGGTMTDTTYAGTASFTSTTRPTSAGTGTPAATSLTTARDTDLDVVDFDKVALRDDFIGGTDGEALVGQLRWERLGRNGAGSARPLHRNGFGVVGLVTATAFRAGQTISFDASNLAGGGGFDLSLLANTTTVLRARFSIETLNQRADIGFSAYNTSNVPPSQLSRKFVLNYTPIPSAWQATTAYILNQTVRPTTANGRSYLCTTAGTTSGTEPTWPTTNAGTVTDGTAVWTEVGNGGSANWRILQHTIAGETAGVVVDTGVAVVANTWYIIEASYNGTQWIWTINGTSLNITTSGSLSASYTATFATESITTSSATSMSIDYWGLHSRLTRQIN